MLLRRLDLLSLGPKWFLFKTNKIKNITIKYNNDRSGGDDEHWLMLACGEADGGDEWYNTLEGKRKWSELLHMAEKYLKDIKKTREKHVEEEGERVRGGLGRASG
jgi:hypothetical protein